MSLKYYIDPATGLVERVPTVEEFSSVGISNKSEALHQEISEQPHIQPLDLPEINV